RRRDRGAPGRDRRAGDGPAALRASAHGRGPSNRHGLRGSGCLARQRDRDRSARRRGYQLPRLLGFPEGGRDGVDPMSFAMEGPAGSGESTTAREVARRLGFRHLGSGAFYRGLTYAALRRGIPVETWDDLSPGELDAFDSRAEP